jgi:hypothetical protein
MKLLSLVTTLALATLSSTAALPHSNVEDLALVDRSVDEDVAFDFGKRDTGEEHSLEERGEGDGGSDTSVAASVQVNAGRPSSSYSADGTCFSFLSSPSLPNLTFLSPYNRLWTWLLNRLPRSWSSRMGSPWLALVRLSFPLLSFPELILFSIRRYGNGYGWCPYPGASTSLSLLLLTDRLSLLKAGVPLLAGLLPTFSSRFGSK